MTLKMRLGLVAVFVVLSAVAVAGWVRITSPATPASIRPPRRSRSKPRLPLTTNTGSPQRPWARHIRTIQSLPFDVAAGTLPEFAAPRCVRTVRRDMPAEAVYQRPSPYGDADRADSEPPAHRYVETRDVHHRRSTRRSVEIVAGSAGVGAAIGAIAGGGKGAGIGALQAAEAASCTIASLATLDELTKNGAGPHKGAGAFFRAPYSSIALPATASKCPPPAKPPPKCIAGALIRGATAAGRLTKPWPTYPPRNPGRIAPRKP